MPAISKSELEKTIISLQEKLSKLSEKEMTKSALSTSKAALTFLNENIESIQSIDMDTGYGHVTFKLKR